MMTEIQRDLFAMQDKAYRDFHARLLPTLDKERIIGVRTPQLRAYARRLTRRPELRDALLAELPHRYYEENNLHAWLIPTLSRDIDEVLRRIEEFLPYVDNWATCDMFAPKIFAKHPAEVLARIPSWLASPHTYTVRFAIVTLLSHFCDEHFSEEHLQWVARLRSDEYYVDMAAAWYLSVALVKQWEATLPLLQNRELPDRIHRKTIQKAVESYRLTAEQKRLLRSLR